MVTILTDSNQVCNPKSKVMVKDDGDDIKLFLLMQPAAYILRTTFRHCCQNIGGGEVSHKLDVVLVEVEYRNCGSSQIGK